MIIRKKILTWVFRGSLKVTARNVLVISNWVHPPGQPRGKFFERANPGHPGNFFGLIPCPGATNNGRIPRGGAKFSQTEETAPY